MQLLLLWRLLERLMTKTQPEEPYIERRGLSLRGPRSSLTHSLFKLMLMLM